jgi:hypothetical protein
MSQIKLAPNASGTGIFTIDSPNSNTNRTLTLPDNTGTILTSASTFAGTGPAFRATLTGNQTITNNTNTKIQFNSETFDTNTCYDPTTNYRFTPTTTGYYQVNLFLSFTVTDGRQYFYQPYIYKNGSSEASVQTGFLANAGGRATASISVVIYLNGTTDYIEFYVYTYDYTALSTTQVNTNSVVSAALVRSA